MASPLHKCTRFSAGVNMLPVKKNIELQFPSWEFMVKAARTRPLELDGTTTAGVGAADCKQWGSAS